MKMWKVKCEMWKCEMCKDLVYLWSSSSYYYTELQNKKKIKSARHDKIQ